MIAEYIHMFECYTGLGARLVLGSPRWFMPGPNVISAVRWSYIGLFPSSKSVYAGNDLMAIVPERHTWSPSGAVLCQEQDDGR